jgi:hypothetical protein
MRALLLLLGRVTSAEGMGLRVTTDYQGLPLATGLGVSDWRAAAFSSKEHPDLLAELV